MSLVDPWLEVSPAGVAGTGRIAAAAGALRRVEDLFTAASRVDDPVWDEVVTMLDQVRDRLESAQVVDAPLGLPGRGQTACPDFVVEEVTPTSVRGRVTFGAFHVGNGAAHGGAIAMLFDMLLGRLSAAVGEMPRTAYLHVDYRGIAPLDTPLDCECHVVRTEGRKRFMKGELTWAGAVLAEGEALFIEPDLSVSPG